MDGGFLPPFAIKLIIKAIIIVVVVVIVVVVAVILKDKIKKHAQTLKDKMSSNETN